MNKQFWIEIMAGGFIGFILGHLGAIWVIHFFLEH